MGCDERAVNVAYRGQVHDKGFDDLCLSDVFSMPNSDRRKFRLRESQQRPGKDDLCDPALSAADTKLGGLYTAALQRLSERGRHQLRDDQRVWLHYLSDACPISADADAETAERAESCMESAYSDRMQDLSRLRSGKARFFSPGSITIA